MKVVWRVVKCIIEIAATAAIVSFASDQIGHKKSKSQHQIKGIYEKYFKRPLDCFLSTGALIVFSPILIATAILVRFKIGSPVLFTQDRPGKDGKIFKLYKFRSMTSETNENGDLLSDKARLTDFGKKLRATSLDELPELINIVKGDMAVIGPRPLLVQYLPLYNEHQARRHEVRPGLTGLAQANGRNALSWESKFDLDVQYVDDVTFKGDVRILADTVKSVLHHDGISAEGTATMDVFKGTPVKVEVGSEK